MKKRLEVGSFLAAMAALACAAGCRTMGSDLKAARSPAIELAATVSRGEIVSRSKSRDVWTREIEKQLEFLAGAISGEGAVLDINRITIDLDPARVERTNDGFFRVPYAARIPVAWPRAATWPSRMEAALPLRGDLEGRTAFVKALGAKCIDEGAPEVSTSTYWYYYRPNREGCGPLAADKLAIQVSTVDLSFVDAAVQEKAPEFGRVWEDRRLTVTWLIGEDGRQAATAALKAAFGEPQTDQQGALVFAAGDKGDLIVRFTHSSQGDAARRLLADSDVVIWQEEGRLQTASQSLLQVLANPPQRYQFFLLLGAGEFAFLDPEIMRVHGLANPEVSPTRFFEAAVIAWRRPKGVATPAAMTVLRGFVAATQPYGRLLRGLGDATVIVGADDNFWPEEFEADD